MNIASRLYLLPASNKKHVEINPHRLLYSETSLTINLLGFHVPKLLPLDLAADGLWQVIHEFNTPRVLVWGCCMLHVVLKLFYQVLRWHESVTQYYESLDDHTPDIIRNADNSGFLDSRMLKEGTFHLEWANTVS